LVTSYRSNEKGHFLEFGDLAKSDQSAAITDDIDLQSLGRAVWRAKGWIVGLAIVAGVITLIALSMIRPLYRSEARILIQND